MESIGFGMLADMGQLYHSLLKYGIINPRNHKSGGKSEYNSGLLNLEM